MKNSFLFLILSLLTANGFGQDWQPLGATIYGESPEEQSGWSTSVNYSGNRVAIGAYSNDDVCDNCGEARVYEYDPTNGWQQLGQSLNGTTINDSFGYHLALNASGNRLAVGAIQSQTNDLIGYVQVYDFDTSTNSWQLLGDRIIGDDGDDYFGVFVSLSENGDRMSIGSHYNDFNGTDAGLVRTFEYVVGVGWVQLGQDILGDAAGDFLGLAAELNASGDRLAIGAFGNDTNGTDAGQVRIYEYDSTLGWEQLGNDINGENSGDRSGFRIDLTADGNRVVIGAPNNTNPNGNSGQARVYEYDATNGWVQLGLDLDGDAPNDKFGNGIAISPDGTRIAVGADKNDANGTNAGHVKIFEYDSTLGWQQLGMEILGVNPSEFCGFDLSLNENGSRVVISSPSSDVNSQNSGLTRVFEFNDPNEVPVAQCQNISAAVDDSGTTNFTVNDINNASYDPDGSIASMTIDPEFFSCSEVGTTQTVTLTVTDNDGESTTCTSQITVIDEIFPMIACPQNQTVQIEIGNQYTVPDYIALGEFTGEDNCIDPLDVTIQQPMPGTLLDSGEWVIEFSTEDNSGNLSSCSFVLNVEETLGVNDFSLDLRSIKVYPNPAINTITLSNPKAFQIEEFSIYDMTGRLIKTFDSTLINNDMGMDISNLSNSVYILLIRTKNNGILSRHLIKE